MSVHIHLAFDNPVEGHTIAAEMLRRFPDNVIDVDTLDDDDTAEDIDLLHHVASVVTHARTPDIARAALSELIPLFGKSNDAMRFIDQAIAALPETDATPPHGTPRPLTLNARRPRTTGTTPQEVTAKEAVRNLVGCPKCDVPAGRWCRSGATNSMGAGTMHADRIDQITWVQS